MIYNFDIKPTRKLFKQVCMWLEQHIDRYFPTDKPDSDTRVYKSMVGGKNAVVSYSKQGVSVETEEDLSEYFNRRSYDVKLEIYDRSPKEMLKRTGISLIFYILNMNALWAALIIDSFFYMLPGGMYALSILSFPLTIIAYFTVFFLTFGLIYKNTGERSGRTLFIQGGGIFTVLHIAFLILMGIAYAVYKNVKESYVIPNFTVEQIERGRGIYYNISEIAGTPVLAYLLIVLLPLIVSFAIASNRFFYTDKHTVKESEKAEMD